MKGRFKVRNIEKYKGDPTTVIYRSSWELKVMMNLDHDKDVIKWSSEEVVIPYRSPEDGNVHRYFMDFYVERMVNGKKKIYLIEVKPFSQTKPPAPPKSKKPTKKFLSEAMTYAKNVAKWKAAERFCEDRGWSFEIHTERELFGKIP